MYQNSPQVIHKQVYSIVTKQKCINCHAATPTSLRRVIAITGSSEVWVQEVTSEVVSLPRAMM
jgi:hypothetical protein